MKAVRLGPVVVLAVRSRRRSRARRRAARLAGRGPEGRRLGPPRAQRRRGLGRRSRRASRRDPRAADAGGPPGSGGRARAPPPSARRRRTRWRETSPRRLRVRRRYESFSILAGARHAGRRPRPREPRPTSTGSRSTACARCTRRTEAPRRRRRSSTATRPTPSASREPDSRSRSSTPASTTPCRSSAAAVSPTRRSSRARTSATTTPTRWTARATGRRSPRSRPGPPGVAPDATIVALKVVKGTSCDTAQDSDILAAVNWAVTNQATLRHLDHQPLLRRRPHGRPRARLLRRPLPRLRRPPSTPPNAAGIVFVASSGNDALDERDRGAGLRLERRLGGRRVSRLLRRTSGGRTTRAARSARTPRSLRTRSSASRTPRPNLSLLAPGAFWLVVTQGRQRPTTSTGPRRPRPPPPERPRSCTRRIPSSRPTGIASLLKTTGRTLVGPAQRHRDAAHRHARGSAARRRRVRALRRRPRARPRRLRLGHGDGDRLGLHRHARQRRGRGRDRPRRSRRSSLVDADRARRHHGDAARPLRLRAEADQRRLRQDARRGAVARPSSRASRPTASGR